MTDSTDDIVNIDVYSLAPLEDDCKLLGTLLDDCLKEEVGEELFKKLERVRALAQCASQLAQKHDQVSCCRELSMKPCVTTFACAS